MSIQLRIIVEVKSAELKIMEGVARRTGRPYKMVEQSGWVDLGKEYPVEMRWVLGDNQAPFAPGRYYLDASALYVDRNGALQISMKGLKAVPQPQAAAAVK